jgi:hypothetical protein
MEDDTVKNSLAYCISHIKYSTSVLKDFVAIIKILFSQVWLFMSVISAIWEAEIIRIKTQDHHWQKVCDTPSGPIKAGMVACTCHSNDLDE